MTSKLIFGALLVTACVSVQIPSTLKKCDRKDKNFSQCLLEAVQDAFKKSPIKEIGYQSFDPLDVPSLVIGEGSGAVAFKQNYKNVKIKGMSDFKCSSVNMDFNAKTLVLNCTTPLAHMEFNYEINGKILLLPIYGKGPGVIDLVNAHVSQTFNLEEHEKKGKKYFKIVGNKMVLNPQQIKFKLENLFDGDKALGDNINQVLNDNWSEVYSDVKSSYEDAFGQIFAAVCNGVFAKVSISELFGEA